MPRLVFRARLGMALLLCAGILHAQPFNFVNYSLADGLPQSQVFAMCPDSRGHLWLGTQGGGLSRFDGEQFEQFSAGLPSNYVGALLDEGQQRLWVGTNRGLCRFDGRRFETIRLAGSDAAVEVYALARVQENTIWIGTDRGLFACALSSTEAYPVPIPNAGAALVVTAILPSASGVWVGTNRGLWQFGSKTTRFSEKNGLAGNAVWALALDEKQRIWVASLGGLSVLDEKKQTLLRVLRDPLLANPTCLQADGNGQIWIGTTTEGLLRYRFSDSTLLQLTEKDGLPHQYVRCLWREPGGQLWAGTSGGGLARLSRQPFRHYDQSKGLGGNRVYALHEDRQGRLWIGVSQNGLQVLDSAGFHPFTRDSGYLRVKCKTIAEDPQGNLWVGTEGKGVVVFDSARMHRLNRQNGLPGDLVQKIIAGPDGAMWIALLTGGIVRARLNADGLFALTNFGQREGLPDAQVQALIADAKGNIWFGTQSGQIGFLKNGQIGKIFDQKHGLPDLPVRALAFDRNGRIWAGTKGGGIFWAMPTDAKPYFQPIDPSLRSSSPNIYLLKFDAAGNLWAGSETGVDKLVFGARELSVAELQHFGKNEGFLGIETCQDAVLEDHAGYLWFGTMNGLTRYVPMREQTTVSAPLIHFETISLFYKPLSETAYAGWLQADGGLREGLRLPHAQNHLSFAFRAVDLSNPDGLRYRWRLEGAETEWSPLSTQTQVNYANLAPGQYAFLVQASADGETFSAPIRAAFVVREPLWRLWWFQVLAGLGLVGLVALLALGWVRRIRSSEQARREKLEVENRLLQLEQKALQLQMNPHFIFNALTSIQALITEQEYPQARQEINHFAQLMRGILANSRRQTISLQEEVNTLEQYLRIEQFCHRQKFNFDIELPPGIDAEELDIPPMLLQPFVENAVVHGVSPLPYPGNISIRFQLKGELLQCEICDNGIGRERAARLREEKKPGHQSAALQVTQERLEALRGGKNYTSLEMSDILDEKGEIAGTRVLVQLPVDLKF
ncbi:MAG: histidine kinase [Saprospiraceae bacterium]|nr:histidine kinase [Saprospiraceae bacterium]